MTKEKFPKKRIKNMWSLFIRISISVTIVCFVDSSFVK